MGHATSEKSVKRLQSYHRHRRGRHQDLRYRQYHPFRELSQEREQEQAGLARERVWKKFEALLAQPVVRRLEASLLERVERRVATSLLLLV